MIRQKNTKYSYTVLKMSVSFFTYNPTNKRMLYVCTSTSKQGRIQVFFLQGLDPALRAGFAAFM